MKTVKLTKTELHMLGEACREFEAGWLTASVTMEPTQKLRSKLITKQWKSFLKHPQYQ